MTLHPDTEYACRQLGAEARRRHDDIRALYEAALHQAIVNHWPSVGRRLPTGAWTHCPNSFGPEERLAWQTGWGEGHRPGRRRSDHLGSDAEDEPVTAEAVSRARVFS